MESDYCVIPFGGEPLVVKKHVRYSAKNFCSMKYTIDGCKRD